MVGQFEPASRQQCQPYVAGSVAWANSAAVALAGSVHGPNSRAAVTGSNPWSMAPLTYACPGCESC